MATSLLIEKKYILIPASPDADTVTVAFYLDGKAVEKIFANLCAPQESKWTFTVDFSDFSGRELAIHIEPCSSQWAPRPTKEGDPSVDPRFAMYIAQTDDIASYTTPFDNLRPVVHYTSPTGWINDPNGCVFYNGVYNLSYQYEPGTLHPMWDNSHWGHAVSADLFHWTEKPSLLRWPNSSSGTAFVNALNGRPCICCGDKIYESGDGGYSYDERYVNTDGGGDPKMFYHKEIGAYIAITLNDADSYRFSRSSDLVKWERGGTLHGFHECPEMYRLRVEDEEIFKWVLHGGDGSYLIGEFDGKVFTPDPIESKRIDPYIPVTAMRKGGDIEKYNAYALRDGWNRMIEYSFQIFMNMPDDRVVRTAWAMIDYQSAGAPFTNCLALPQEVKLRRTRFGLRLCALPVRELEDLRGHYGGNYAYEFIATASAGQSVMIGEYTAKISDETLTLTHEGMPDFVIPYLSDGNVKLRAVIDSGITELFVGDGEVYIPLRSEYGHKKPRLEISGKGEKATEFYELA